MDLDASLKSHGSRLAEIESFVTDLKRMMSGNLGDAEHVSDQLDGLLAFKSEVEGMLPMMEKAVADVSAVTADLEAIKKDLAPALAWIAERQKADEEAKAVQGAAGLTKPDAPETDPEESVEPKQPTLDTVTGALPAASEPVQQGETEQIG